MEDETGWTKAHILSVTSGGLFNVSLYSEDEGEQVQTWFDTLRIFVPYLVGEWIVGWDKEKGRWMEGDIKELYDLGNGTYKVIIQQDAGVRLEVISGALRRPIAEEEEV